MELCLYVYNSLDDYVVNYSPGTDSDTLLKPGFDLDSVTATQRRYNFIQNCS